MTAGPSGLPVSKVVAAQDSTLSALRDVFDQVDVDLADVVRREEAIASSLDDTTDSIDEVRARLRELGVDLPAARPARSAERDPEVGLPTRSRFVMPDVVASNDFQSLLDGAEKHLDSIGVDLSQDPLQQVLPNTQIATSLQRFAGEHGEVSWSRTDWMVVLGAGTLASLLDIVLVRIPRDTTFLGRQKSGSPLTAWLKDKDRAGVIHAEFLAKYESWAKVPYDAATTSATGGLVSGMRPATHRLQSLGHDPLLGFVAGIADIMRGTGTYFDQAGRIIQVAASADPVGLIDALLTQIRHLLSDVYTPAGLPPPLFTLLQLGTARSPFALGPSGVKVPWTDVARYMYTNGYDLRHFFTAGISPGVIEAMVRGYVLLDRFAGNEDGASRRRDSVKLRSMLLFAHSIAASGTLVKTGLIFGMNPLALNYAQLLAMAPASIAWLKESVARDRRIESALEKTWQGVEQGSREVL